MNSEAKTRQQVAAEFGITTKTLNRWLVKHQINATPRERLCPKVLKLIHLEFGDPVETEDSSKKSGK